MEKLTVGPNDAGQRLDKLLSKTFHNLPKSMMYKLIRVKKIKVNRKRAEIGQMLCEGDTVELFVAPEFLLRTPSENLFLRITPAFGTVYEDENLILCHKPVGLLSHSDEAGEQNTLIEHIKAYLYRKGEYDPEKENSFAPALCNRLDRNTSGLVLAAKNAEMLRALNEAIKARKISKFYLCRVHGIPEPHEATLVGYLQKNAAENRVTVREKPPRGKEREWKRIVTKYRLLGVAGGESVLEVELVTGRTHQIRAHLAFAGYPLVGDGKYADNADDRKIGRYRQALCAYRVRFEKDVPEALSYLAEKSFSVPVGDIPFTEDVKLKF